MTGTKQRRRGHPAGSRHLGGKRPGAGRPRTYPPGSRRLWLWLSPRQVAALGGGSDDGLRARLLEMVAREER